MRFDPEVVRVRQVVEDQGQKSKCGTVEGARGGPHHVVFGAQPEVDGFQVGKSKLVDFISKQNLKH